MASAHLHPTKITMPDLSELEPNRACNYCLRRAAGGIPSDQKIDDLALNYARLLDKTVVNYHAARKASVMANQSELAQALSSFWAAVSYLESCIGSYCRTVTLAIALKEIGAIPDSSIIPAVQPFRDIRNSIQHLDERIEEEFLDSFGLSLGNDIVWIGGDELTYEQLASCIKDLYHLIDIIQNPPRISYKLQPAWLTPPVVTLARQIKKNKSFGRLPELADLLTAAGCHDTDLLSHLRRPGPHLRGWCLALKAFDPFV